MPDSQWIGPPGKLRVDGLRDLIREAREINEAWVAEIKEANLAIGRDIADAARPLIPVRSGNLRDSLRVLGGARGVAVAVGKNAVPYAGPIHFGWLTRHILPQPFLYDALDSRRDKVIEAYEIQIDKLTERIFGGGGI